MSFATDDITGTPLATHEKVEEELPIEVELIDDRPEEDQVPNRDPNKDPQLNFDLTADPDEEIVGVKEEAGKRIKKLRYEYHDQRRQAESATRERDEAITYAQQMTERNKGLQELLQRGEQVLLSELQTRTTADQSRAEVDLKEAVDSGDGDKVVKATKELNRAQYDAAVMQRQKSQVPPPPQQPQQQPLRRNSDPLLAKWMAQNPWFGNDDQRVKTSVAFGIHEDLVRDDGFDPKTQEYYDELDKRMNQFEGKSGNENGSVEPAMRSHSTSVVAPGKRSGRSPRKVSLTTTEANVAKRLGLTIEQYAASKLKGMEDD